MVRSQPACDNTVWPGVRLEAHLQFLGLKLATAQCAAVRRCSQHDQRTHQISKPARDCSYEAIASSRSWSRTRTVATSIAGSVCNEAIFTVGRDWRVSSFSEGAQQLFGYSAAEVTGLPLDLLLKDRTAELIRIKQFLDTGWQTFRNLKVSW